MNLLYLRVHRSSQATLTSLVTRSLRLNIKNVPKSKSLETVKKRIRPKLTTKHLLLVTTDKLASSLRKKNNMHTGYKPIIHFRYMNHKKGILEPIKTERQLFLGYEMDSRINMVNIQNVV